MDAVDQNTLILKFHALNLRTSFDRKFLFSPKLKESVIR